jgi:hypothetical protein
MVSIHIEVGMFQRWTLYNRKVDLHPPEVEDIIKRILNREKIKYSDDELGYLKIAAMSNMEFDQLRDFRRRTGFDTQVVGFCRSIGLPADYHTPKA